MKVSVARVLCLVLVLWVVKPSTSRTRLQQKQRELDDSPKGGSPKSSKGAPTRAPTPSLGNCSGPFNIAYNFADRPLIQPDDNVTDGGDIANGTATAQIGAIWPYDGDVFDMPGGMSVGTAEEISTVISNSSWMCTGTCSFDGCNGLLSFSGRYVDLRPVVRAFMPA